MRIEIEIPEYTILQESQSLQHIQQDLSRQFPFISIGRDSYITKAVIDARLEQDLVYNFQIGRYSSCASGFTGIIDMNHDYKRVCQGRISNALYFGAMRIKRKGQIIIMNDCWIGENVTILGGVTVGNGAVIAAGTIVTRNIPPYAIVAGNPAQIIGYRFEPEQIEALNVIRWWNWSADKVQENSTGLYGDIDTFIQKHICVAEEELSGVVPVKINPIEKSNQGEGKVFLYIPDFEQDYPTYPKVIEAFVQSYSDTNYELLLYVKEDHLLSEKLSILDSVFDKYKEANCYINLYIGNVEDERSLFCQVDAYLTNRSKDNVYHVDLADLFGIPVISSVDEPIFERNHEVKHMVPVNVTSLK